MAILRKHTNQAPAYIVPTFSKQELGKLNQLVGMALTSRSIHQRLITNRDSRLSEEFGLASETWQYVSNIKASTLEEFCQAIQEVQIENLAS